MRVQDMMSKDIVSINPGTKVTVAREALERSGIDHLVVLDGKRLVGVVSGSDLSAAVDDRPVSDVMSRHVVTVGPEETLRRAAGIMRGRNVGCLPVVDDDRVIGIVTTSDLLTALAKGEIHAAPPPERVVLRKRGPRRKAVRI